MKAYFIGGGIGSLAGAAFLIRDAQQAGRDIVIYEAQPLVGGSLDGTLLANGAYSLRGGRMLTTDHYECTWDLLSSIPSLEHPGLSVREETIAFNLENPAHSKARLVDRNRFKVDVSHMGFLRARPARAAAAHRGLGGDARQ
ncbi:myosin-crossreactive antigen [Bradyrhizobium ottawaense]